MNDSQVDDLKQFFDSKLSQSEQRLKSELRQEIKSVVDEAIRPLRDEIQALRNDIREIYDMISELQSSSITDKAFKKRTLEEKLLTLNTELLTAAKQAGIVLPRR